jgi:hypothetical protein
LKPVFDPSAEDFLDALSGEGQFRVLLDHILDELRALTYDPYIDMEEKFPYVVPAQDLMYRILWGRPVLGRRFWYIYEAEEAAELLRIYNIGHAGLEQPFLSRR